MVWSIARKIRLLLWSSLGATLGVALVLVVVQSIGDGQGRRLESELGQQSDRLARQITALEEQQGIIQRILREQDPDTIFALVERDSLLRMRVEAFSDSLGTTRIDSAFQPLEQLDATLLQMVLQGRTGDAQDLYLEKSARLMRGILEVRAKLADDWSEEAQSRRASWRKQRTVFVTMLLLAVLLGEVAAWFAGRRLVQGIVMPLEEAQRTMEDIAAGEGDLTRRLEVRTQDEIGRLSEAFNRFVERVHRTVQTVEGGVGTLGGASDRIAGASKSLVEGADSVAHRSREVADASREVGKRVESASLSAGTLSQGLSMIASAVEELTASVREISKSCQAESQLAGRADRDVGSARDNFRKLFATVGEMTSLLEGIQDISDQTQLLALNATIEAARAGEAGRGFAVVAASVKDLAKQASGTTKEINARIEAMTNAMGGAEASITSLEQVVGSVRTESDSIAAAVEEQGATITELSRSISETHRQSESIASDVRVASKATESSSRDIEAVSQGIAQAVSGIGNVREGMREIETLSGELRELVRKFKT